MVELKTFFGLLYLQTSLKSNFSLADVILGHGSLYKKDGDALRDSYVDKKKSWKKTLLSFQQCIQVSVLRRIRERNLIIIHFMITQKEMLMWFTYIFSSIYTLQISPMAGECTSIFA